MLAVVFWSRWDQKQSPSCLGAQCLRRHVYKSLWYQHRCNEQTRWYPSCFTHTTSTVTKMSIQYHSQKTTSTVSRYIYIFINIQLYTIYYIHTYICIPSPYAQSLAYATLALRLLHLQDLLQLRAPAMTNPRRCTDHVTHQGCAILLSRARGMHARISNFWASLRGFWYQ